MSESHLPAVQPAAAVVSRPVGGRHEKRPLVDLRDAYLANIRRAEVHALKNPDPKNPRQMEEAEQAPDGKVIAHPVFFMALLRAQEGALKAAIQSHREIYNVDEMDQYLAELYHLVHVKLKQIAPDAYERIKDDFTALNRAYGIGV